ncbi:MAG: hypothetical protein ABEH59_04780 [Halobacteriales archaeon]
MSRSTVTISRLVHVGGFDEEETDWLLLRLVGQAVAAGFLGLGLLVAVLHGFVRDYVLDGAPDH